MPFRGFMGLIFLIKITFIPVCSKKQSLDPGRGSPHLFADSIQGYIGAAFDDQFIMYMTADKAVGKGLHHLCDQYHSEPEECKLSQKSGGGVNEAVCDP